MEAYKKEEFEANIGPVNFIQDNESKSSFGVLRGLHYQKGEHSLPLVTDYSPSAKRL